MSGVKRYVNDQDSQVEFRAPEIVYVGAPQIASATANNNTVNLFDGAASFEYEGGGCTYDGAGTWTFNQTGTYACSFGAVIVSAAINAEINSENDGTATLIGSGGRREYKAAAGYDTIPFTALLSVTERGQTWVPQLEEDIGSAVILFDNEEMNVVITKVA